MAFRWAITSAGKIAADFACAVRQLPGHEVVAVAARSEAAAAAFAATHCPNATTYEGYDAMFGDNSGTWDACYVATQPDTHAALVDRLLTTKTPTLCEKPLAVGADEVEAMYARAKEEQCFLMEGVWTRCFPATVEARRLLEAGAIGEVIGVQAEFGYAIANGCPASVRGAVEDGGMAQDIGVYMAEKALLAYGPPAFACVDARATAVLGVRDGVDLSVAASLRFAPAGPGPRGGVASLLWTGQCDTPETATFLGTEGSLTFDAAAHTPTSLVLKTRSSRTEAETRRLEFPYPDDDGAHAWNYPGSIALQYEALAVERAVRAGALEAPEWTHADSVAAHRLIKTVRDGVQAARREA
eukprot:CAMPEP_0119268252 /NCGR_PEP_ID=MMETSP1329-20130426/6096_1 /TAXON_ID=114041 /ORGANISM="Genus nov. species nov., Strain RCC1024" /LENGTH=355 /DNA_ID=CAMNT_0007268215 /DNA_START=52 /DNA_END=1116 /DNA_ORIENTATION=+